jgi:hypothetical protein
VLLIFFIVRTSSFEVIVYSLGDSPHSYFLMEIPKNFWVFWAIDMSAMVIYFANKTFLDVLIILVRGYSYGSSYDDCLTQTLYFCKSRHIQTIALLPLPHWLHASLIFLTRHPLPPPKSFPRRPLFHAKPILKNPWSSF